ncbi:hypothetical protein VTI74DRAFT_7141 [Chaetomium olivicolor]
MAAGQSSALLVPVHELPGQSGHPSISSPTTYSTPPTTSYDGVPFMSRSTTSIPGSHNHISPQSSISSVRTSFSTAPTTVDHGAPLFADYTTSSPVDCGDDVADIPPWENATALAPAHQDSWDSATTAAELPASFPEPAQWLRKPLDFAFLPQPGVAFHQPTQPFPALPQQAQQMPSKSMGHLGSGSAGHSNPALNQWHLAQEQLKHMGEQCAHVAPTGFMTQHFKLLPRPAQSDMQPYSLARRNSWSSTTDTILDLPMPDASPILSSDDLPPPPPPDIISLPSQQHHHIPFTAGPKTASTPITTASPTTITTRTPLATTTARTTAPKNPTPSLLPTERAKRRRRRGTNNPQKSLSCPPCGYYPAPGADQRKKIERHRATDKHRRNMGEGFSTSSSASPPLSALSLIPSTPHSDGTPLRSAGLAKLAGATAGEVEGMGVERGARGLPGGGSVKPREEHGCVVCGSSYNRRDNLRQHLKKHGVVAGFGEQTPRVGPGRSGGQRGPNYKGKRCGGSDGNGGFARDRLKGLGNNGSLGRGRKMV